MVNKNNLTKQKEIYIMYLEDTIYKLEIENKRLKEENKTLKEDK